MKCYQNKTKEEKSVIFENSRKKKKNCINSYALFFSPSLDKYFFVWLHFFIFHYRRYDADPMNTIGDVS